MEELKNRPKTAVTQVNAKIKQVIWNTYRIKQLINMEGPFNTERWKSSHHAAKACVNEWLQHHPTNDW